MAGTLVVQTLQGPTSGANANKILLGSGQELYAPGHVIQVVEQSTSTQVQIISTTYTDTGLSASITPSSASSKILVTISQCYYQARQTNAGLYAYIRLLNNSDDELYVNERAFNTSAGLAGNGYYEFGAIIGFQHLDSPSTTSAITYRTQLRLNTTSNNAESSCQPSNNPSIITLMEIAG